MLLLTLTEIKKPDNIECGIWNKLLERYLLLVPIILTLYLVCNVFIQPRFYLFVLLYLGIGFIWFCEIFSGLYSKFETTQNDWQV